MVDQLNAFASEVTRVAREEVSTEANSAVRPGARSGRLPGRDLTDNVNFMASNLTAQVRNIAEVATAIADGDLSKITVDVRGRSCCSRTRNTMVEQLRSFAASDARRARSAPRDG